MIIVSTSWANSSGRPRRLGKGTEAANAARATLQRADEAKRAHNAVNYEIGQLRKKKEQTEAELREASNG